MMMVNERYLCVLDWQMVPVCLYVNCNAFQYAYYSSSAIQVFYFSDACVERNDYFDCQF